MTDGSAAICPRVSDGHHRDLGEAGYLHKLTGDDRGDRRPAQPLPASHPRVTPLANPPPGSDWEHLLEECCNRAAKDLGLLEFFADSLGLETSSLISIGLGRTGDGLWSFPMYDSRGDTIGISLRSGTGRKWAWPGSKNGLFGVAGYLGNCNEHYDLPMLICEGPTDTAAAVGLGFKAIGRPSCTGGLDLLKPLCRRSDVVIVADDDSLREIGGQMKRPGEDGALRLAAAIARTCRRLRIITPHYQKDLRDWVKAGATHDMILMAIDNARLIPMAFEYKPNSESTK